MFDYVKYFTNKAKKATDGVEKARFLKLARMHQKKLVPQCTDACPIEDTPTPPKRGRKKKEQEEGAD